MTAVFIKLFNMSITASWIVLAVILIRLLLKKAPKAFRVMMWGLVGLRLALPFSIESVLSLIPSAETIPPDIIYTQKPVIQSGIPIINSTFNPIISENLAPNPGDSANPMQIISAVAANVWVLGLILMLGYAFFSYWRIKHKVKEAAHTEGNTWECDSIDTPFILGIIKPRIYLPSSLSAADREYVVAHEKAHLKRRDHFWKPIGFMLLTVYWFNPILWIAYVLLCKDIELATDEKVIKALGEESKKPYSAALINCSVPRKAISACPIAFGESSVKERVKAVLNYKKASFWIIIIAVLSCVGLAVFFLTIPETNGNEDSSVTDIGGADSADNVIVTPEIIDAQKLKEKYPEYFSFKSSDSLDVFIWQLAENSYRCGVMPRGGYYVSSDGSYIHGVPPVIYYDRIVSDEEINDMLNNRNYKNTEERLRYCEKVWALKGVSIAEMHVILAHSMVPTERIRVFPIVQPHSSYHYVINEEYTEKITEIFWNGLKHNTGALNLKFALPKATAYVRSVRYDEEGINLGLTWSLSEGFTESTKTEYPKYHVKITVGDKSKFTFLPLPNEWNYDSTNVYSTYRIDIPATEGDEIVLDLYLNDDKTFISNLITITAEKNEASEIPEADIDLPTAYTDFDLDGDGKTERIQLRMGTTSGLYTFVISTSIYHNTFLAGEYRPVRFRTLPDGTPALECHSMMGDESVRLYNIELDGKTIVLRYGKETMGYWGAQQG